MIQTKHTPAPWRYNKQNDFITAYLQSKELVICQMARIPEYKYNARLIEAAPKMLEALKDVYPHIADDNLREEIGNIIIKAVGE